MTTPPAHTIDIAEFEAFCRGKPEGEAYDIEDECNCALAQFAMNKHPTITVKCGAWSYHTEGFSAVYEGDPRAFWECLSSSPHTFSALADRLASLKTEDV